MENGQDSLTNVTQAREGGNRKNFESSSTPYIQFVKSSFYWDHFHVSPPYRSLLNDVLLVCCIS